MFQNEKIVEIKTCKHCSASFEITDKDLEFYEKVSPVFGGKKYNIPTPTLCPDCRQQRRLSFRNERKVFFTNSDKTGKRMFSMYSPDKDFVVYDYPEWYEDDWDPKSYGKNFDFSKNFFEQFKTLDQIVPKMSLSNLKTENSEYVSMVGRVKNCYLVFNADSSEECYYGKGIYFCKNSVDLLWLKESQNCYECIDCVNCDKVIFGQTSNNCSNCKYIFDCEGCNNCIGCVSLKNASYYIFNKKYSKEEYENISKKLSLSEIKNEFQKLKGTIPTRLNNNINIQNCFGDYISKSKNIINCFDIHNSSDIKYSTDLFEAQDVQDINYYGMGLSLSYNSITVGEGYKIFFSNDCWGNVNNLLYCYFCVNGVNNCFGCVGLHNGESYCILNKQYTKEEYEILVPKIIEHMQKTGEWGEFFPSSISPFGYNETIAMEYFPINSPSKPSSPTLLPKREGGLEIPLPLGEVRGGQGIFNRSTYGPPFPKVDKIIPANKLPEDISKIPDDILNWAIECEVTKKPFKIISQELEFYRKHNLPIPRRHPDQRHLDRMALRNPRKLFDRICDKCGKEIKTTYSPERPEIVYCEECYNREIY